MRTTLTLDDKIAQSLQEKAHHSRRPFKDVVNEALALGLSVMDRPGEPFVYRVLPASMGAPRPGVDLVKALALAEAMEDEAIALKLEARK
ncbi:MAG: DUF2191 domain-containing protein [Gammaproteobacteria bacterium]|nr:DUF2191 domain-containing protein [Gammaproteobacteria bacterium]